MRGSGAGPAPSFAQKGMQMQFDTAYGFVAGRFLAVMTEGDDPDTLPDAKPLSGSLELTRLPKQINETLPEPTSAFVRPRRLRLDAQGYLVDEQGSSPVAVPVGVYAVRFLFDWVRPASFTFEVTEENTADNPVQIPLQGPIPVPPHTEFVFSEQVKLDAEAARDEAVAAAVRAEDAAEVAERVGMKEYASIGELDAVTESEVGIVRNFDLEQITPQAVGLTCDLVVTTTVLTPSYKSQIVQSRSVVAGGAEAWMRTGDGAAWSAWVTYATLPSLPAGGLAEKWAAIGVNIGGVPTWTTRSVQSEVSSAEAIVVRDLWGRSQFTAPAAPLDAANKEYVDAGSIKTYATAAELDAVRQAEVGIIKGYPVSLQGVTVSADLVITTAFYAVSGSSIPFQVTQFADTLLYRVAPPAGPYGEWVPKPGIPSLPASTSNQGDLIGTAINYPAGGATSVTYYLDPQGVSGGLPYLVAVNPADRTMSLRGQATKPQHVMTRADFAKAAPASSAAPGIAGDRAYDANYLYVCVAANSWRRIPLETF